MASCCMNRRPPSPDAPPSRPLLRRHFEHRVNAVAATLSSSSATSRLSKPEDIAALQEIFESEKSPVRLETKSVTNKESSNTLNTVKQKLKKHLSRESENSKRLSRSSVGTSEEEVERRAELRRIRQKRIRDELSTESIYDDDAKSLTPVVAAQFSSSLLMGTLEHGPSSLPLLTSPPRLPPNMASAPQLEIQSIDSPIRHINSCVDKGARLESRFHGLSSRDTASQTSRSRSEPNLSNWNKVLFSSAMNISRRLSSPDLTVGFIPERKACSRDRNNASPYSIPPASTFKAIHPTNIMTIPSSWRLSFCAPNRGEHLRKLSQGGFTSPPPHVSHPTTGDTVNFGFQSVNKWINSQGLRIPSQTISSDNDTKLDLLASHLSCCSPTTDFGGVDGGGDPALTVHLDEMEISRRLAPYGLHSSASSPQLSICAYSHRRGISLMSGHSRKTQYSRHRNLQNTSDSFRTSQYIPEPWNVTLEDGTSSFYPSGANSIQPSPRSSHLDLLSLFAMNNEVTDLHNSNLFLPSILPKDECMQMACGLKTATAILSPVSLTLPPMQCRRRSTLDDSSIAVSETDSYRQRELELGAVKTRFIESEVRSSLTSPRPSKFREDFTVKNPPTDNSTKGKKSVLSQLTSNATWSYDGQIEQMLGVPLLPVDSPSLETRAPPRSATRDPLNALSDLKTAQIWGKAVYLNAFSATSASRTSETTGSSMRQSQRSGARKLSWGKMMNPIQQMSESNKLMAKRDEVIGDWEREMDKSAQKAKDRSKPAQKPSISYDRRYPASWSRFSSFDRAQRTNSARSVDGVEQRDFVIQSEQGSQTASFHSGRKHHLNHYDEDELVLPMRHKKRSLLKTLGETWKEKISNTADIEVYETIIDQARGRRGSLMLAGRIEYPELELLPMDILSGVELEHQVEEELEEDDIHRKEDELDAIFNKPLKHVGKKLEPVTPPPVTKAHHRYHLKDIESPKAVAHTMGGYFERIPHHKDDKVHRRKGHIGHNELVKEIDTTAFDEQVTAVVTLKEKMDAAAKRGGKRGPVARKQLPLQSPCPSEIALRRESPDTHDGALESTDDEHDEASHSEDSFSAGFDDLELSIADPKFYDDCILSQILADNVDLSDSNSLEDFNPPTDREKFKTWSGKEWMEYKHGSLIKSPRRVSSFGDMLRKSTDEFQCELLKMEKLERENALRAAERAWGDNN